MQASLYPIFEPSFCLLLHSTESFPQKFEFAAQSDQQSLSCVTHSGYALALLQQGQHHHPYHFLDQAVHVLP
uniref:Uncharacterized protein MANES_12G021100 n=1 Tax=Rhizophora mucronata TaxID=61149 RepID=A0A2P2J5U5_RHIMU